MPGLSPVWVGCEKMWQRLHLKPGKVSTFHIKFWGDSLALGMNMSCHFVANLGLFWQQNLQTWTTEAALGKMFRGVCRVSKQFVCSLRNEAYFSNQRTSMQYKSDPADYPCRFFTTSPEHSHFQLGKSSQVTNRKETKCPKGPWPSHTP